jgi:heptaprenyl diphosphate synthase
MTQLQANNKTQRLTLTAMLSVIALMFSYVEAMIPVTFGIPGFKLGFANIMIIIAIYILDARFAFGINLFRIILSALLFGTPFSMMYSLAGGMLSLIVMLVLKKTRLFSVIGVSMAAGVLHNLGQLFVAAALIEDLRIFFYFPVLLFSGIAAGIFVGIVSAYVLKVLH